MKLVLAGPRGPIGATGIQGPIGPQGPQGVPGDPGDAGTLIRASQFSGDDDTTILQRAVDFARDKAQGGHVVADDYRDWVVEGELDLNPSVPLAFGCGRGSRLLVKMSGAGNVVLRGTNVGAPTTRGFPLEFRDLQMAFHSSIAAGTTGPVFIEKRYASRLVFSGVCDLVHQRNNTILSVSNAFNTNIFGSVNFWYGGRSKVRKAVGSTARFSIASGTKNLSSTEDSFASGQEGTFVTVNSGNGWSQTFLIDVVVDTKHVTTHANAVRTFSSGYATFEPPVATFTSGSNVFTLGSSVLTSDDVSATAIVLNARTNAGASSLRGKILTQGGNTFTLGDADGNALNAQRSGSGYFLMGPSCEFYAEGAGGNDDFDCSGLRLIQGPGGLFLQNMSGCRLRGHKFHGSGPGGTQGEIDDKSSVYHMLLDGVSGSIDAYLDQQSIGADGSIRVMGQFIDHLLLNVQGSITAGKPTVYVSGGDAISTVYVANHNAFKEDVTSYLDVIAGDGTTKTGAGLIGGKLSGLVTGLVVGASEVRFNIGAGFPMAGALLDIDFVNQQYWWNGADRTTGDFASFVVGSGTLNASGFTPATDTIITVTLAGVGSVVPGVMLAAATQTGVPAALGTIAQLDDGTDANRLTLLQATTNFIAFRSYVANAIQCNINCSTIATLNVVHGRGASFDTNNFLAAGDGTAGVADTSGTIPAPTLLRIGKAVAAGTQFIGSIQRLVLFGAIQAQGTLNGNTVKVREPYL